MSNEVMSRIPTSGEICRELVEHMKRVRHLKALRSVVVRIEREQGKIACTELQESKSLPQEARRLGIQPPNAEAPSHDK